MPFTPLHMGPGMALKALGGRRFSLVAFGFVQVALDVEVLIRILRGDTTIHGLTHTYLGCLVVAAASLPVLWGVYPWLARIWGTIVEGPLANALAMPGKPSLAPAATGLVLGALSHVALDSIMHWDMRPLWPFSQAHPTYQAIGIDALHLACLLAGVLGLALFASAKWIAGRRTTRD